MQQAIAISDKKGAPATNAQTRRLPVFYMLLLAPLALFLAVMVIYPLVIAVLASLGLAHPVAGLPESFTLEGYRNFFDISKPALAALWFTIKVTTITAVLSTGLGFALAIYLKLRAIELPAAISFIIKLRCSRLTW